MNVRFAEQHDIKKIAEIYSACLSEWDTDKSKEKSSSELAHIYKERLRWFESREDRYKILVLCDGDKICAFSALDPFGERGCFSFVSEISVYVDPTERRKGYAKALVERSIKLAKSIGFYKLIVTLFSDNMAGEKLFKDFGFSIVGTYKKLAYLHGQLIDANIYSVDLPFDEETIKNFYNNLQ